MANLPRIEEVTVKIESAKYWHGFVITRTRKWEDGSETRQVLSKLGEWIAFADAKKDQCLIPASTGTG